MRSSWLPAVLLALTACDGGKDTDVDTDPPEETAPEFTDVVIRFRAEAADVPFACNKEFKFLGSTGNATVKFGGLWVYLSNIGLLDASGSSTLLDLEPSMWQAENIGLLDFEDGSEYCTTGNPETNVELRGRVPTSDYTGLAFTIGIPPEVNHRELDTSAVGPLNRPELFNSVLYGYNYFSLLMSTLGERDGYPVYVRATGCQVDDGGNYAGCTADNIITVSLPSFDATTQTVVFDLRELLAANNLDANAASPAGAESAPGCQSDPTDPDCQSLFVKYGLAALPPEWVRVE
jgi:uncharacterized repeat protein (TIGR04052 family)